MKSHIFSFLLFDLFDFIFSISTLPGKTEKGGPEKEKFPLARIIRECGP